MAADHGVPIGQALGSTGVFENAADIVVGDLPSDRTRRSEFGHLVAMRERHERVAVVQPNGGERPVLGRTASELSQVGPQRGDDLTVRGVLLDRERQQMGYEVIAVLQLSGHAGLHVGVFGLGLERRLMNDRPVAVDFKQPRPLPQLGDQRVAVVQTLHGSDLGIVRIAGVREDHLLGWSHLFHPV